MRRIVILAAVAGAVSLLVTGLANAGAVAAQFGAGAFGLPWSATKATIEAKYPGGKWDQDGKGHPRYCVASKQQLLKLPPPNLTQELCFLIGKDNTLASATATMPPSLASLLAVGGRSRTIFGDYDSIVRDEQAIQSRFSAQLWTKDPPFVVMVRSENDDDGAPTHVTFTIADEGNLYTEGSKKVDNRPGSK